MSPKEEQANVEALRRIREVENSQANALDLAGLHFLKHLPRELASLTSLETLDLSECWSLTGDLSPLGRLKSLQTLRLSWWWMYSGDLSPLAGLKSLQTLDLSEGEDLSGDLGPLTGLKSLQTLNLSGCKQLKGDLSPLAGLKSLQTLDLRGCEELKGDLSPLAGLKSLQTLSLHGCWQLGGDLSPLGRLKSLQTLHLSWCRQLWGDLSPLGRLKSLQTLHLTECVQLSGGLSPLAGLKSLQTLHLSGCKQLSSDLSPLAGLKSLQTLDLSRCGQVTEFGPLEVLLPTLQQLHLFGCNLKDVPSEVCGERHWENVLNKVRAHYEDLKSGQRLDPEVKVLFLGNGGTGKTQLCRRLRGEPFDHNVSTTHPIQLSPIGLAFEEFKNPVRLNLWDFGGQEIYHGTHALFLQGQAVFLILWTPELECQTIYKEGDLSLRHRPLSYWLDYLRTFAGVDSAVLMIQSQCDERRDRVSPRTVAVDDFCFLRWLEVSAKTGLRLELFMAALKEAVRDCFELRPPPPIGKGRVAVRDRLRKMFAEDQALPPQHRRHRLLERAEFDQLCEEEGGISDKEALLDFLHHSGVVFYRPGLFGGRIVLDQNWVLEAIYTLFDRKKTSLLLRANGRFSRGDLEALFWSDYTVKEQEVFLDMMQSCGICFRVRELQHDSHRIGEDKEWEYLAPELLPPWSDAQQQLLGRLREDQAAAEAEARYAFLHEGVLRGYLSKIGQHAKDAPIYWKYGCWFYERTTKSQVLIESQWEDSKTETGPGKIRFRAWGEQANALVRPLLEALQTLPVGRPPEISPIFAKGEVNIIASASATVVPDVRRSEPVAPLEQLEISASAELPAKGQPEVFVSYAWGDDSSEQARQRTEVVDRLCQRLDQECWKVLRDNREMRPGDQISAFMKRIGLADHVIVVLSDKYLHSPYCMTELHAIYRNARQEKQEFLDRIIPLSLDDAHIGTPEERVEHAKHWQARYLKLRADLDYLSEEDFCLYRAMKDWYNHVGDMLVYVSDVLHPHGFEAIVKDDFSALREMLH
jgi:internalin A